MRIILARTMWPVLIGAALVLLMALLTPPGSKAFEAEGEDGASRVAAQSNKVGQFKTTKKINKWLRAEKPGVLIRAIPDYNDGPLRVGSFARNDILNPTVMYPVASANCTGNESKWAGYTAEGVPYTGAGENVPYGKGGFGECDTNRKEEFGVPDGTDSYTLAVFGWIRKHSGDFSQSTFYPHDANSIDDRAYYNTSKEKWETPDGATNGPAKHRGRGCKADFNEKGKFLGINQNTAESASGTSLVEGFNCKCNTSLIGDENGNDWVDHWIKNSNMPDIKLFNGSPAFPSYFDYFTGSNPDLSWEFLEGKYGKAESGAGDLSACWTTNVQEMVNIQNSLWTSRVQWYNGLLPQQPEGLIGPDNVEGMKYWYGWNEVPVKKSADKRKNHAAWLIKLPAGFDSLDDLTKQESSILYNDVRKAMASTQSSFGQTYQIPKKDRVVLNDKKKSRVVVMVEDYEGGDVWQRQTLCQNFTFKENKPKKLKVKFKPAKNGNKGHCYLKGNVTPKAS